MKESSFPLQKTAWAWAYFELTKPQITIMVMLMAMLGFFLGGGQDNFLFPTIIGIGLTCAGAAACNHVLEWKIDCQMIRTCRRPIPQGVIAPWQAALYGTSLIAVGTVTLLYQVNTLTAMLVLCAGASYILVYTPLKRISWLNTYVGAIPGALPPVAGWAAATNSLSWEAGVLFLILYFWQHPHFYAIAWIWQQDYRRGGFQMLSVVDPSGKRILRHTTTHACLLLVVSLLPTAMGMTGMLYLTGVLGIGLVFVALAVRFAWERTNEKAYWLLKISVLYLPLLLLFVIWDKRVS